MIFGGFGFFRLGTVEGGKGLSSTFLFGIEVQDVSMYDAGYPGKMGVLRCPIFVLKSASFIYWFASFIIRGPVRGTLKYCMQPSGCLS